MTKSSQKKLLVILVLLIIALYGLNELIPKATQYMHRKSVEKQNLETISQITAEDIIKKEPVIVEEVEVEDNEPDLTPTPATAPDKAYLEVQFICQAPLETETNWEIHEESCEEAALLQAYLYETGQTMTKEEANDVIIEMLDWQKTNWNGHYDIYAKDVSKLAQGFYGIEESEIEIINNADIGDVKEQISMGYPVIAPVTSDYLDNPFYPHPGYHMLIVIGYTEDSIITNDNGTRRGKDFSYENEKFEKALKDAGGDIVILKLNKN